MERLKSMWIETFGDSKEYVNLIADCFYDERYVKTYRDKNNEIISMLWSVPYEFIGKDFEKNIDIKLKGLYLCGLATNKKNRGMGIMKRLIEDIETYAFNAGFDFTFLIPADEGLRGYYNRLGYVSMPGKRIYKLKYNWHINRYINNNIDRLNKLKIFEENKDIYKIQASNIWEYKLNELKLNGDDFRIIHEKIKFNNIELINQNIESNESRSTLKLQKEIELLCGIYGLNRKTQESAYPYRIDHSFYEIIIAVHEINISGGKLLLLIDNSDNVTAFGFCYYDELGKTIDIRHVGYKNKESLAILLTKLKTEVWKQANAVKIVTSIGAEEPTIEKLNEYQLGLDDNNLVKLFENFPVTTTIEEYGMMKWLNRDEKTENSHRDIERESLAKSQEVEERDRKIIYKVNTDKLRQTDIDNEGIRTIKKHIKRYKDIEIFDGSEVQKNQMLSERLNLGNQCLNLSLMLD